MQTGIGRNYKLKALQKGRLKRRICRLLILPKNLTNSERLLQISSHSYQNRRTEMAAHGETSSVGGFQFSSPPVKMLAGKLRECTRRAGPTPSFWLEKDPSGGGGQLDESM
ncbi:recQ-mediated genome instability protein 2 isoform X2 [Xenopus tropicalis]|uniref:RecQ-mediated genome instability protein 2 isoform X2 n=1 Tax=Xenopus tropicalis TaxID=8364 RepID=A0A8J0SWK1_XENTR|nr:recQ-mediated genome instability protein 2 isoform X2 [Xenopus tropicalis]|eukprot:XP_012826876.1 PREDICTED: recQ-mediated genome instability protein 2 isoform X2 [Xenopus tropicalis]